MLRYTTSYYTESYYVSVHFGIDVNIDSLLNEQTLTSPILNLGIGVSLNDLDQVQDYEQLIPANVISVDVYGLEQDSLITEASIQNVISSDINSLNQIQDVDKVPIVIEYPEIHLDIKAILPIDLIDFYSEITIDVKTIPVITIKSIFYHSVHIDTIVSHNNII